MAEKNGSTIPKVIHYFWIGGKPIPESNLRCIESWKKYCPDYKIVRHDETNYDFSKNKYMREAYEHKKWGFVTDFARLDVIYNEGGIYLDTDVEVVKSLDPLLEYEAFMGFEDSLLVNTGIGFGAKKKQKGIEKLLKIYDSLEFVREDGELNITPTPNTATEMLEKNGLVRENKRQNVLGIEILPTEYLCPKSFETGKIKKTKNTYSIHHYDMSWVTESDKKRHTLVIGCRKIFGIKAGSVVAFVLWYLLHPIVFLGKIKKKLFKLKQK